MQPRHQPIENIRSRQLVSYHLLYYPWFYKEHFKTFCEAFVVEFYLKLKLILRIITYLTYICLGN